MQNFEFTSTGHLLYEGSQHVSGSHYGARRLVKVEPNNSGGEGYPVTLYNLNGTHHPVWCNNVQISPKQLKIIREKPDKTVLRGYDHDAMRSSFADCGVPIHFHNGTVRVLYLYMTVELILSIYYNRLQNSK